MFKMKNLYQDHVVKMQNKELHGGLTKGYYILAYS